MRITYFEQDSQEVELSLIQVPHNQLQYLLLLPDCTVPKEERNMYSDTHIHVRARALMHTPNWKSSHVSYICLLARWAFLLICKHTFTCELTCHPLTFQEATKPGQTLNGGH